MNIQINEFNLSGDQIVTGVVLDESTPQALNLMKLAREDGAKLISSNYEPKKVSISGIISGTSRSDLETNIDTFKKNTMIIEGNLDIDYEIGYRRFTVDCSQCVVTREHHNITVAAFELNYVASNPPFAEEVDAVGGSPVIDEAFSADRLDLVEEAFSCMFSGTAEPKPKVIFRLDTVGNLDTIKLKNLTTNIQIEVGTAFSDSDVLDIDTEDKYVRLSGTDIEFEGVFPEFDLGLNNLRTDFIPIAALDQSQEIYNNSDHTAIGVDLGQSFEPSGNIDCNKIEILGYQTGSEPEGFEFRIETDTAGSPSGNLVDPNATKTITDVPFTLGWISIIFPALFALANGTTYWIVIKGGLGSSFGFVWKGNTENKYADGLAKVDVGGWMNHPYIADFCFRVYKDVTPTWSVDTKITYTRRYL